MSEFSSLEATDNIEDISFNSENSSNDNVPLHHLESNLGLMKEDSSECSSAHNESKSTAGCASSSHSNNDNSERNLDPVIWQKFQFLISILKDIQINILEMDTIISDHQAEESRKQSIPLKNICANTSPECEGLDPVKSVADQDNSKTDEAKLTEIMSLLYRITTTLSSFEHHPIMNIGPPFNGNELSQGQVSRSSNKYNFDSEDHIDYHFKNNDAKISKGDYHETKSNKLTKINYNSLVHPVSDAIENSNKVDIYPISLKEKKSSKNEVKEVDTKMEDNENLCTNFVLPDKKSYEAYVNIEKYSFSDPNNKDYNECNSSTKTLVFDSSVHGIWHDLKQSEMAVFNGTVIGDLMQDEDEISGLGDSALSGEFNSLSASINDIIEENKTLHQVIDVISSGNKLCHQITPESGHEISNSPKISTEVNDIELSSRFNDASEHSVRLKSTPHHSRILQCNESEIIKELREDNKHCNECCRKLEKMVLELWRLNRKSRMQFVEDLQAVDVENCRLTDEVRKLRKSNLEFSSVCNESNLSIAESGSKIGNNLQTGLLNSRKIATYPDSDVVKGTNKNKFPNPNVPVTAVNAFILPSQTVSQITKHNLKPSNSVGDLNISSSHIDSPFLSLPILNDKNDFVSENINSIDANVGDLTYELGTIKSRLQNLEKTMICPNLNEELVSSHSISDREDGKLLNDLMAITKELFSTYKIQKEELIKIKEDRDALAEKLRSESVVVNETTWKNDSTLKLLSLNQKLQEECAHLQGEIEKYRHDMHSIAKERDEMAIEKEKLNVLLTNTLASIEQENTRLQISLKKFEEEKRQYMMKAHLSKSKESVASGEENSTQTDPNHLSPNKGEVNAIWQQSFLWLQRCIVEEKLHSELLEAAQKENSARVALLEQRVNEKGEKYRGLLAKYKKLQMNLMANKAEMKAKKKAFRECGTKIQELHSTTSAIEDNYRVMLSSLGYSIGVAVDILSSHLYFSPAQIHPSPEFSADPAFWFAAQCSRLRWLQFQLRKFGLKSWQECNGEKTKVSRRPSVLRRDLNVSSGSSVSSNKPSEAYESRTTEELKHTMNPDQETCEHTPKNEPKNKHGLNDPNFNILSELNDSEIHLSNEHAKLERTKNEQFSHLVGLLRQNSTDTKLHRVVSFPTEFSDNKKAVKENLKTNDLLPTDNSTSESLKSFSETQSSSVII